MRFIRFAMVACGLFLTCKVYAGQIVVLADGATLPSAGATTVKVPHALGGLVPTDNHTDIEYDANYASSAGEVAFFHFPYPPGSNSSTITLDYNLETAETGFGLQHCIAANACAMANGQNVANCGINSGGRIDNRFAAPDGVGGFIENWTHTGQNAGAILQPSGAACDLGTCGNSIVRLAVYRLDSQAGCTNPSNAAFRIKSVTVNYTP